MDNDELKHNLTSGNQWMRLLYMVLFVVLLEIAGFVMLAVVILQFLFSILSGGPNDNLRRLGDQIASYVYQTLQFLVYNTDDKPFPFAEWPESDVEDLSGYESAEEVDGEVVDEEQPARESAAREEKSKGAGAYVPVELGTEGEYEDEKKSKSSSAGKTSAKKNNSSGGSKNSSAKSSSAKSSSAKGSSGKSSSSSSSAKSSSSSSAAEGSGKSAATESSAERSGDESDK